MLPEVQPGRALSYCTACWWKLNSFMHVHCLLVEAAFFTVHAGDGCDTLSKLHDFTLHRLLVEVKFLTARALPADGSRISSGLARHFSLIPKHEFMYDMN